MWSGLYSPLHIGVRVDEIISCFPGEFLDGLIDAMVLVIFVGIEVIAENNPGFLHLSFQQIQFLSRLFECMTAVDVRPIEVTIRNRIQPVGREFIVNMHIAFAETAHEIVDC